MPSDHRPLAIALMGPTASGKTALALDWAQRLGGEIVSVDSALVYRGLDIGAAKPDAAELARVPHHLIDVRDPWQRYSAAEFAADARAAIAAIVARGKLPILTGGTGLYFQALLHGLSPMPEADAATRAAITEAEAVEQGWPAMHAQLAEVDPEAAARIHATDPQRIQRALEVFRLSGKPISAWQREAVADRLPCRVLKVIVSPRDRAVLHARIEQRFDAMLDAGFLDEVRRLRALPELRAVAAAAGPARAARRRLPPGLGASGRRDDRRRNSATVRSSPRASSPNARSPGCAGELDARWFDPAIDGAELDQAIALFLA